MSAPSIAVVGGGIIGCLVARELLARRPDAEVTVLDADTVGSGASRRSAGLHFPRGLTDRVRRMSAASEEYYEKLRRELPAVPVFPVPMAVVAARTPAAELRRIYLDSAALTPASDVVHPGLRPPAGTGVWTGRGAHYADVSGLVAVLTETMRGRVRFREGVRVDDVEPEPGGGSLLLGTGERLRADRVVVAPGPWLTSTGWREFTADAGIRVKKVVALHLDERPDDGDPLLVFHDEDAFLLPVRHRGHWLFSYTCQEWDVDPDSPPEGLSAEHLAQARQVLGRYAPDLAAGLRSGRVFCDAYSPDRQPVVRPVDAAGRVVFAGAANGSGYRLAPAIAADVVDHLDLT